MFLACLHDNNESYKKDIDHLVELMSKTNVIVKIALLQKIWQQFVDSDNEAMANYITDTYLLNLAKEAGYTQLIEILTSI